VASTPRWPDLHLERSADGGCALVPTRRVEGDRAVGGAGPALRVGDPTNPSTELGHDPQKNRPEYERVLGYIGPRGEQGARVLAAATAAEVLYGKTFLRRR